MTLPKPDFAAEQEAIHQAIQRAMPEETPGAVLTGWTVVAEWMDPKDARKWLSRMDGPEGAMTNWKRKGMLLEAAESGIAWSNDTTED